MLVTCAAEGQGESTTNDAPAWKPVPLTVIVVWMPCASTAGLTLVIVGGTTGTMTTSAIDAMSPTVTSTGATSPASRWPWSVASNESVVAPVGSPFSSNRPSAPVVAGT